MRKSDEGKKARGMCIHHEWINQKVVFGGPGGCFRKKGGVVWVEETRR